MKKFFVSLVALVCATLSFAQSSLLATLSHDGKVSTFYGSTALRDAHNAAANGDIITLSSGTFVAVDITKAVTIRGAGMEVDTIHNMLPTTITGDFKINIADSVSQNLTLEGIYHSQRITYTQVKRPKFLKCRFESFYNSSYGNGVRITDAQFIHCRIANTLSLISDCSASLVNCIVNKPYCNSFTTANFEFRNCVIHNYTVYSSAFYNCILDSDENDYVSSSNSAYYCVASYKRNGKGVFDDIPNSTNKVTTCEELFKTYKGGDLEKQDSEKFELTEAAKKKYIGTDGTEVGIYGGMLPFDSTPSNPQITKCNVAAKSTADGKLSVDIEVKAAE